MIVFEGEGKKNRIISISYLMIYSARFSFPPGAVSSFLGEGDWRRLIFLGDDNKEVQLLLLALLLSGDGVGRRPT